MLARNVLNIKITNKLGPSELNSSINRYSLQHDTNSYFGSERLWQNKIEVKCPMVQSKMDEIGVGGKKLCFQVS